MKLFSIAVVLAMVFLLAFRVQWGSAAPPPFRAKPSGSVPLNLFDLTHPNHAKTWHQRHARPRP